MDFAKEFVHLARIALGGQREDLILLLRRSLSALSKERPDLAAELSKSLAQLPANPYRGKSITPDPIPVDLDSRQELLRRESNPTLLIEPTWPENIQQELDQVVLERSREEVLRAAKIMPTRSLLFVGPPGVGKSLAARYLAARLNWPLLTLDLAAVMSSFLGRTGSNIRAVLDFARRTPAVLLLDEFDAIAKRRDDSADVGELKRLVTVLLQAIDDWPYYGILLGATNHPDLLDPAVWRRFDRVVHFPLPSINEIQKCIIIALKDEKQKIPDDIVSFLASLLEGKSFADIQRIILTSRREALISDISILTVLKSLIRTLLQEHPHKKQKDFAVSLHKIGFSQREASEITGVSRDTIRRYSKDNDNLPKEDTKSNA